MIKIYIFCNFKKGYWNDFRIEQQHMISYVYDIQYESTYMSSYVNTTMMISLFQHMILYV